MISCYDESDAQDYDRRIENDAQEVSVARSPGATVRRKLCSCLYLFIAIARVLLDSTHSRTASKEIIFTYLVFLARYMASACAPSRYYYLRKASSLKSITPGG
jgi:hypothetical protein